MELDRTLWLTADKERVVEAGDENAAFLLGNEGTTIDDDEAKRLGITAKKAAAKTEDKQADAPANKARSTTKK